MRAAVSKRWRVPILQCVRHFDLAGRMASVAELQPQAAPSPAVRKRIENLVNRTGGQGDAGSPQRSGSCCRHRVVASLGALAGRDRPRCHGCGGRSGYRVNLNTALNGQVSELSAKWRRRPKFATCGVG